MATFTTFTTAAVTANNSLFRNLNGWKFDQGVWGSKTLQNKEFKLPKADEIDLSGIPDSYFQSGVLSPRDLELEEINFVDEQRLLGWAPGVRRGQFFSQRDPGELHGSDSAVLAVRDLLDAYGRSYVNLDLRPDLSVPITAQYLQRDSVTYAIEQGDRFQKVSRFKGLGVNGKELDTEADPNTIDSTVNQFQYVRKNPGPISHALILGEQILSLGGDLYEIATPEAPVRWAPPQFDRPDLFLRELSFDLFQLRQTDPVGNGPLVSGDYAVGYRGHWSEGLGVRLYQEDATDDFGQILYKKDYEGEVLFNKDVRVARSQTFSNLQNETVFYLTHFPVLDLSTFENLESFGDLVLDVDSATLTVDGNPWTRVADLSTAGIADEVYHLDPLFGTITFGDGGITSPGALPVGEIVFTYTQVPFIEFDFRGGSEIFTDAEEDLDPQVNALRQGFLVLDTRRLLPYRITLTANAEAMTHEDGSCCYGPLNVPPGGQEDLMSLRARVLARGNPPQGVPNIPVRFESLDGLLSFSQDAAVTDGEGYAYTEVAGISRIQEYIISDYMYEAMPTGSEDYLNPAPGTLAGEIPPWGNHFVAADTLTFGERFDGDVDDVYVLIQSIRAATEGDYLDYSGDPLAPEDDLDPYNGLNRRGGITVLWSQEVSGAQEPVRPLSATPNPGNPNWTDFAFPINLPTGHLIVSYKIVIDRTARVRATVDDPDLVSNQVSICLELNSSAKGQWKLPDLAAPNNIDFLVNPVEENNLDGSRIGTAVFMSPNDIFVDSVEFEGGGLANEATVGDSLVILGQNFPVDPTLKVNVFIVKIDSNGDVVAMKNITADCTFVDSQNIAIPALPTPPTEEYDVNYWIAVAGFPIPEEDGTRYTAWELEIHEA